MFPGEAKSFNCTDPSRKALEAVHAFCVRSVSKKEKTLKLKTPLSILPEPTVSSPRLGAGASRGWAAGSPAAT